MAPTAARRAATAAVRYAASTAKSAAAAPPRAAAIHHAGPRAAAPPSAAAAIHYAGPRSAAPPGAATSHSAVASNASSSVAATRSAATPPSPVSIHHASSSVAATRSATGIALPAGNRVTARFGLPSVRLTRSTSPTGTRFLHVLVARPIDPRLQIELSRLDARAFCRYKEIAEALQLLGQKLAEEEAATLQYMTEQVIHVGTVSWRVCTTVLTVAVAAGIGVLQLSKTEWETEFHEVACSLITSRLAENKLELEDDMVKVITHRRNVAVANAFLHNEKMKEKALELAEREAALVARGADLVAREAALVGK